MAPLQCSWTSIKNNKTRVIEGITGAFYQPCADDIDAM